MNFGPHFLAFLERSVNVLRHFQILWTKVQKRQSYVAKTLNLWGCDTSGTPSSKLKWSTPDFFRVLRSTLDILTTCKFKIKSCSINSRIQGSKLEYPKIPKKIPQKLGFGVGSPNFGTKVGTEDPYRPMPKLPPKTTWGKRYRVSKFELWSTFPRNWWTLAHFFRHFWKALGQGYKPAKFRKPKFKNKNFVPN